MTITQRDAYAKGYSSSQASVSGDMDAAEARYTARYGVNYVDYWIAGWSDYSCGNAKWSGFAEDDYAPSVPATTETPERDLPINAVVLTSRAMLTAGFNTVTEAESWVDGMADAQEATISGPETNY